MLSRADSVRKPSETNASPKELRSTAGLARRVTAVDKQLWTALYSGFMALEDCVSSRYTCMHTAAKTDSLLF